ncbi:excisionase family DNA-binding protein [Aurantimonas sp. HBX-1]|uniref:excisionase family DNA-binding protein n=1 Tax=Aurantimonas sp. HBX-1 TaxID=2906072 RepID=UPI001F40AE1C|nr:excisionase family DNA-binding protein [Aurantimonas sp. HBX-1]UIJ71918.1 helix-turn-helix domain-containing protein [Aurantimonas sp. HBX-1]
MTHQYSIPSEHAAPGSRPEKLITFHEAADVLGVHYWQIQRAVKRGDIPSYRPFNSRRLVKLSEVVAFIEASRHGGGA